MSRARLTPAGEIIRRLLSARGITRYALFLTQGEGKKFPNGVECLSGFILSEKGEVYGFWLDWDQRRRRYVLDPWYQVEDLSQFASDPEYRRAREQLGLE